MLTSARWTRDSGNDDAGPGVTSAKRGAPLPPPSPSPIPWYLLLHPLITREGSYIKVLFSALCSSDFFALMSGQQALPSSAPKRTRGLRLGGLPPL